MTQHPRVAVIGAGPAGLTLANLLYRHGCPVTVFEADDSSTSRDQGGTLDLHADSAQIALKKIGLLDQFLSVARHEDQEERDIDYATGAVLREEIPAPGTGDRPEIDRLLLRKLLLEPLGGDVVRWNTHVEGITLRQSGEYDLRLRSGAAGPYDLVVGADGAWSRVRAVLTDVQPSYTGVTFVELWLSDVDRRHPAIAQLVGHGTMFSLHDGSGIIAQRNGGATIRVYAALHTQPEETDRPDRTLNGITARELLSRFEGWAPSLLSLIAEADLVAAVRPIVALPTGLRWPSTRGLTLIGDAAHVMPPLGVGVNLAMLDAADLGEEIITHGEWPEAIRAYETTMFERAEITARQVEQGFAMMFAPDGANIMAIDRSRARGEMGPLA